MMSYLELPAGILPNFQRTVISLWFIVEQDAVDKARADVDAFRAATDFGSDPILPPLYGIIPLVTFGAKRGTYNRHTQEQRGPSGIASFEEIDLVVTGAPGCSRIETSRGRISFPYGANYVAGKEHPIDPCYIGVYIPASGDFDENELDSLTPKLTMRMQYGDVPTISWLGSVIGGITNSAARYQFSGVNGASCGLPSIVTDDGHLKYIPNGTFQVNTTYKDITDTSYDGLQGRESIGANSKIKVTPGKWHHLLLSFDFSGKINATGRPGSDPSVPQLAFSDCKLWVALDDKNYTENDLPALWMSGGNLAPGGDPNAVITSPASSIASTFTNPSWHQVVDHGGYVEEDTFGSNGPGVYSWTPSYIPEGPMGIPATSDIVDKVRHCEMAEFQMWFGKFMDTAIESNRRAFIDVVRDQQGNPMMDKDGNKTLEPVPPNTAEKLVPDPSKPLENLGRPDILLHTTRRWQKGQNTGSLGLEIDTDGLENLIPSGQFTPRGVIKKYTPDPSLKESSA